VCLKLYLRMSIKFNLKVFRAREKEKEVKVI